MTGCVEKMKDKFLRFMYGRYGVDQFSKCLVVLGDSLFTAVRFYPEWWYFLSAFPCHLSLFVFSDVFTEPLEALR